MPMRLVSGRLKTLNAYTWPMQRWMQSAAGGTSKRLKPGAATVRSRSRNDPATALPHPTARDHTRAGRFLARCRFPAPGRAMTAGPQPSRARAFSVLFLIEMWERFGYYGMQVLLVVFVIEYLGFRESRANLTWGALAAMIYAVPVLGGWVGDRMLGARRTTMLGAVVLCLGYGLLSVPWKVVAPGTWSDPLLFFSLGVVATGNGLFKANPSSL